MKYSCSKCPSLWSGLAQCHCSSCCLTFSGLTAFDRHRSLGKCKKPSEMVNSEGEPVFELRDSGIWAFPSDTDWNAQFGREAPKAA